MSTSTAFRPLVVRRRTSGFQTAATVGIRAQVIARLTAAGPAGCVIDSRQNERTPDGKPVPVNPNDLIAAWPVGADGTPSGTYRKVMDAARILAGDAYGYVIEVAPVGPGMSVGLTRIRLAPGENPATPSTAPDSAGPTALNASPVAQPADTEDAKDRKDRKGRKG